ncbi:MAG: asparagine synthase-related protein [Candidatus Caldarchaeum sp.]
MLKYFLTFGTDVKPQTFASPTKIELGIYNAVAYVEGAPVKFDGYLERVEAEKGFLQAVHSVNSPFEPFFSKVNELTHFLAESEDFCSGVLFDDDVVLFRDFVGLIPFFAGGHPFTITNVKREAIIHGLVPLEPGTIYDVKTGEKKNYHQQPHVRTDVNNFIDALRGAVRKFCPPKTAVFFSGGIDSLILAKIIVDAGLSPLLLTVGTAQSTDLRSVEKAAKTIGLDAVKIVVDSNDVQRSVAELEKVLGPLKPMDAAIGAAMHILSTMASEQGYYCAVIGQGADEVFGGYKKYENVLQREGYDGLHRSLMRDFSMLGLEGLVRDFTAVRLGGAYPLPLYLTKTVLSMGLNLPVTSKLTIIDGRIVRKHFLRLVCRELGLLEYVDVGKKALQYGSGIEKLVKRLR